MTLIHFFFITFQSWENLVENKLETSIRSAQPSKKRKTDTSALEKLV